VGLLFAEFWLTRRWWFLCIQLGTRKRRRRRWERKEIKEEERREGKRKGTPNTAGTGRGEEHN